MFPSFRSKNYYPSPLKINIVPRGCQKKPREEEKLKSTLGWEDQSSSIRVMQKQKSRRVFFFYPSSFSPRFHSNSTSRFAITLKTFRRDIYRPITGKERLFGQTSLGPWVQLKFKIPSEFLAACDVDTCRQHLSLVLADVEYHLMDDEESIVTHDCCHVFHKLCLWRWIRTNSTCPFCRHPIYSRPKFLDLYFFFL
ncbi:hypothetical protein CARUB_v10002017mg [Capsella rubella]|uniref:RING-type domain-containing protein n=1 Tax=Capsella rubella TaxID=81985 RepID=R0H9H4_9BRAS|nr:uncharacterized protein LOC17882750 [Capsella rubella]EOA21605.1 hypothetical protein CARUB_v10002017mg [Capsella rubella]